MPSIVEPKTAQQMGKRDWTTDSLEGVIARVSELYVISERKRFVLSVFTFGLCFLSYE